MEIDLATATGDTVSLERRLRSEVCIIGGGIAGLTLARELLRDGGVSVTLLEAGGRECVEPAQGDPFHAELRGRPHRGTGTARVRALGGTSLTWGGQLLPLPSDAEWPVAASELWPAAPGGHGGPHRAAQVFEGSRVPEPGILHCLPDLTPRFSTFLPFSRRNLRRRIADDLRGSKLLRVALHARVAELRLGAARDRIAGVQVMGAGGQRLFIEAEQFVMAAGTVETCRLLLASRSVAREGVGNGSGSVGVNFHDHLTVRAAELSGAARVRLLAELRPWFVAASSGGRRVASLKLEPNRELRERLGLHPAMVHLTIEEPESSGVDLLRTLLKSRQSGERAPSMGWLRQLPRAAWQLARLAWEARVRGRRYVSPAARVFLQLNVAQDAPSGSRVLLSEDLDAERMPRAVVDWRVSEAELRTLRRLAGFLRDRLAAAGVSEGLVWHPGLFDEGVGGDAALLAGLDDARHAMGGACMGADPATSVVDPELRVHGIRNLSIVSPAVFPDGAPQLPAMTLEALGVRLAQRLRSELP